MDDKTLRQYVDGALAAQGFSLSREQRREVILYFSRTAQLAQTLQEFSVAHAAAATPAPTAPDGQ